MKLADPVSIWRCAEGEVRNYPNVRITVIENVDPGSPPALVIDAKAAPPFRYA